MKPICAEVFDAWKSGPGETWVIIKLDDDRVKTDHQISFRASDVLGFNKLGKGDHLQITVRKVDK